MLEALIAALETIEDPRCEWKVEHRLLDILVIAVCAVLGLCASSHPRRSNLTVSEMTLLMTLMPRLWRTADSKGSGVDGEPRRS